MNNIIFNQNINETSFLVFKRKNRIIIDEIIPFINDFLKITISITNEKINDNETDLPMFDGDKGIFNTYRKSLLYSFKEQYFLNDDIYNFRNEFFENKKILKSKNNKAKKVTLKSIDIVRKYSIFYVIFKFSIKIVINKELKDIETNFECPFAEIEENSGLKINYDYLVKFKEKYNIDIYNKSIIEYKKFLDYEENLKTDYKQKLIRFRENCENNENLLDFIY